MDNDDNDYQGSGLHLGEESSKVSPALRPYTLPKFDFDVGQIRFDNLVENEVFLGIPSQEDNQWIEDFSRGNSGLEFRSAAADSCSIPRHNNVWSEATSSETVEMLLKSVGQEEMAPVEPHVQDSSRGESPSLTKQMDDKIDNSKDSNSVVGPEVIVEFSKANKSSDADECMFEAQQVDVPASGPPAASNDAISLETDVNMQMSCDDGKTESVLVNDTLNKQIKDDTSGAEVEVPDAGIVQDATPMIQKTDEQVRVSDVYHENLHPDASSVENLGKSAEEIATSNIEEPRGSKPAGNYDAATGLGPYGGKGISADEGFTQKPGTETSVILVQSPSLCSTPTEASEMAGQAITQGREGDVSMVSLEDTKETNASEHISAPDLASAHTEAASADIVEEFSSSHDGGGHGVLVHGDVAEELPSDSSKLDHDSVAPLDGAKIAELPSGDVAETNIESTNALENDNLIPQASNFEVEKTSKTSPNIVDSEAVLGQTVELESYPTNKSLPLKMEVLTGAKTLSSQGIGDETFQQVPDSGGQVALVASTDEEVLPVAANVEQAVHENSVEPSDKIESSPVRSELNVGMDKCVEGTETHMTESEELQTAASSGVSGGSTYVENEKSNNKSDDGNGPSQMITDEQVNVNEDKEENVPISNIKELVDGKDPVGVMPQPEGGIVASEEEKSFSFDVSPLAGIPEDGTTKSPQSISQIKAENASMVLDGSPSTPLSSQKDPEVVPGISLGMKQTPGKGGASKGKGASERKATRGSAKSGKENARKRNTKQTVPVSISSPGGGQSVEGVDSKKGVAASAPDSSLPDLNSSSQTFQQPFTDQQQVQLRAQIFVYGSIIQGIAPDEACMVSAFGISDGTRSWEPTWRACLERYRGQISHSRITETPIQIRTGSKALDQSNKPGSSQIKLVSTPFGQASSNNILSPANPMIPLSSPLWNLATPSCDTRMPGNLVRGAVVGFSSPSPLDPYQTQTPTVQKFSVNTSSLASPGLPPSSWVSSAQSLAAEIRSTQPVTEAQILTPILESAVVVSTTPDVAKTSAQGQHSTEKKTRKRKKPSVSKDVGQSVGTISAPMTASDASNKAYVGVHQGTLIGQNDTTVISQTPITSPFSTSVAVATPSNLVSKGSLDKSLAAPSPVYLKPEDIAKVEEAKLQAEEAAGHAAIAVTHCQNVWCQLDKHKNSGLASDVEAKVASAAAAIAASASIAKAAAAAAKIASNVALHAKLMIDETLVSDGAQNSTQADMIPLPDLTNVGNATPASTLKVSDGNTGSSSIIFAAREAAKKKLEAASAASRHAENVEAMVKAAELASEAVSQAGKVAAMVDPLPIAKLVEAGPEGYLKDSDFPFGLGAKSNNTLENTSNGSRVQEVSDTVMDQSDKPLDKELHIRDQVTSPLSKEMPMKLVEDKIEGDGETSAPVTRGGKDLRSRKKYKPSDLSKTSGVVSESQTASKLPAYEIAANSSIDNGGITEGCLVEVFKDNGDFTGAWFSANVLSLKGGKASVAYTDLGSNEGLEKLKEWVPLGAEGIKQPIVRLAHPMTTLSFDGPRKRRRSETREFTWSSGDRVDAWIQNGWREGVVLEKNKKDDTTLSIHFPAHGNTSTVKAWHLRPTLVWKDGEWMEWSNFESSKGDSPQEKRLKLGSPPVEGKGKEKLSKITETDETKKTEESKTLPLSASEKVFNMGTRNENKPEGLRTMRSGLQKEGSKVIFGVPKPGKKRKFMDVSKHYVASKDNAPNDSDKLNKSMIPQPSGPSRPWRNASRVDPKERQAAELNRLKTGLKSGRHPNVSTRTLPRRDNTNALPGNGNNGSTQQNRAEFVSASNNEEAPLSSQVARSDVPKKAAGTSARTERLTRGRFTTPPAPVKSTKVEVKEKPVPEPVVEQPRRSNRKIQPTSRLLEGLQSQITITKFPSASQDKSKKSNNAVPKGNN